MEQLTLFDGICRWCHSPQRTSDQTWVDLPFCFSQTCIAELRRLLSL